MSSPADERDGRASSRPRDRTLAQLLVAPRLVVAEILAISGAGLVGAIVPQEVDDPAAVAEFAQRHVAAGAWFRWLGLHDVFATRGFLALVLFAATSLSVVLWKQWRRVRTQWRAPLRPEAFRSAPYREEFERPATAAAAREDLRSSGRLALLGSPIFHTGLMLVAVAGLVRALFAASGAVDVVEGQELPSSTREWDGESRGFLAAPLRLAAPVRFEALELEHYPSGGVRQLTARLRVPPDGAAAVAVNSPFDVHEGRLYVGISHGPAALVEVEQGAEVFRKIFLLREADGGGLEAAGAVAGDLSARIRAADAAGQLPGEVELRLMNRGALLYVGRLAAGETVSAGGQRVRFVGPRWWARFNGSRDPSVPLAYAGMGLLVLGAALMFAVVRVDAAVVVTPLGGRERVLVALRPHRLAPLYRERFERMVERVKGGART